MDDWRTNPTRPPPCRQCGLVESATAAKRHVCNPTHVHAMRVGFEKATLIGAMIVAAFRLLVTPSPLRMSNVDVEARFGAGEIV